jgi:UDP-glucose:glycoprotein glucosyltransferase
MPFDRVLGPDAPRPPSVVYADITSPNFRAFHKSVAQSARDGRTTYRIRHKPPKATTASPLMVNGYGVELALKRTDYIVIDDRQKEEGKEQENKSKAEEIDLKNEEVADLKPLSSSELEDLGIKAASFVANSEQPLDMLLKLTQDFPKHSSSLAGHNVTKEFLEEHKGNREHFLPSGFNVLFINGVQYDPRKMDPFSLLDHLRRERKLIKAFEGMGLSSAEAITLLSHPAITEAFANSDVQRYDWRDDTEGGNVILWLNNLEKDKRYRTWPSTLNAVSYFLLFGSAYVDNITAFPETISWAIALSPSRHAQRHRSLRFLHPKRR